MARTNEITLTHSADQLGSQHLRFERGGFGGGGIAVATCDSYHRY